jgi:predicted small secreted protein
MAHRLVSSSLIALAVACSFPAAAQNTPQGGGTGGTTQSTGNDREGGFDLGWLGLIGLVGLIGLKRRDNDTTIHRP